MLECRLCLSAPQIASLDLQNDTGVDGDNITTDPTLSGTVSNNGVYDYVNLQFDVDGDGWSDDCASVEVDGSFVYNPSGFFGYGQVTVSVRATSVDPVAWETATGDWVSITLTFEPPPNDPAQVATLGLLTDTGEAGDNITEDPTITGIITNDNGLDYVGIEIDFDGDGVAEDFAYAESDGSFTYNPAGMVNFGEVTIRVRAYDVDQCTFETLYGEWVSITFTYNDPNAGNAPQILDLSLKNDTGDATDKVTEDPTITGTISSYSQFGSVSLQFDFDGDGVGDDLVSVEADGTFTYNPTGFIAPGTVTFYVRTYALDPQTLEPVFGDWVAITFTYLSDENP